jgi:hypothetical protein
MVNSSLSLALHIAVSVRSEGGAGADGPDPDAGSHRQMEELPGVDGLLRALATRIAIGCRPHGQSPSHETSASIFFSLDNCIGVHIDIEFILLTGFGQDFHFAEPLPIGARKGWQGLDHRVGHPMSFSLTRYSL